MKLQNLGVIFVIIIIPITLILSLMISNKLSAVKTETYYNAALYTATRDGIRALEYNSYDNRSITLALSDIIVRDANATVNTFINSLAMNLGLGDAGVDALKPYIPAVAYTMYDGYFLYTPDVREIDIAPDGTPISPPRDVLEHSLKPYIYYTKEYRVGSSWNSSSHRIIINYTLDNFINVYEYEKDGNSSNPDAPNTYKYRGGYVVNTGPGKINVSVVDIPDDTKIIDLLSNIRS